MSENQAGSRLRLALLLTVVVLVVELGGGLISHSLALMSDAGHVLTDVFARGLAWFAVEQSSRSRVAWSWSPRWWASPSTRS